MIGAQRIGAAGVRLRAVEPLVERQDHFGTGTLGVVDPAGLLVVGLVSSLSPYISAGHAPRGPPVFGGFLAPAFAAARTAAVLAWAAFAAVP